MFKKLFLVLSFTLVWGPAFAYVHRYDEYQSQEEAIEIERRWQQSATAQAAYNNGYDYDIPVGRAFGRRENPLRSEND